MAFRVLTAAPFGMLIGYVLPRELEGTLLLLTAVALQIIIDPAGRLARLTPFWSSREIGTYAVGLIGSDYLVRGGLQGLAVAILLIALVAGVASIRSRRRAHLRQA